MFLKRSTSMKRTVGWREVPHASSVASSIRPSIAFLFGRPVSWSVSALRTRSAWVRAFARTACTTRAITAVARTTTDTVRTIRSFADAGSVAESRMTGTTIDAVTVTSLVIKGGAARRRAGDMSTLLDGCSNEAPAMVAEARNGARRRCGSIVTVSRASTT